jgi:D-3-phosphoglycerate dehydrogenase
MKNKLVVCDDIHEDGLSILKNSKDIDYVNASSANKDELLDIIKDADVIITRSSTDVNDKLLKVSNKLKAIVRAGVGVDNVDIDGCSKRGIIVMNVPTANTIAAVELTMTHLLSCVRTFPYAHNHLKQDRVWDRNRWYSTELKDKKLGVIGFGNIGSRVALRAKAFEMEVIAYDPYIPSSRVTDKGIEYTKNFDDILECDIITIHTPKNSETIDMINDKEINQMRDGVILINCARGGLYNENALYKHLKSGKIKMAGIDVFSKEPAIDHPLLDLDNVTLTPHLGANTRESQKNIAICAAEQALNAIRCISYPNALNLPICENGDQDFIKPYLELTQKLGFLCSQIKKSPIESIEVISEGDISEHLNSIAIFAIVGSLKESLMEKINYVNALHIAKERGIEIVSKNNKNNSPYKNRVTVRVTTRAGTIKICGTIFDNDIQKIVQIDEFLLDISPKGKMIFFKNSDVLGVVGDIGSMLANYSINISDFRLGRNKSEALAIIVIDDEIDASIIEELKSLKACIGVSYAKL